MMSNYVGRRGANRRRAFSIAATTASVVATSMCFAMMLSNYPGMYIAFYIALVASAIIAAYLVLCSLVAHGRIPRLALVLRRCLLICLGVAFVGFLVLQGLILSGARSGDVYEDADCLVILGAGLYGEVPSKALVSRLDKALEYLEDNGGDLPVVVSGGQGEGESIAEAEAMYRYLLQSGIGEDRIWREGESTSTLENLAFSMELLEGRGLDTGSMTVAIVTNEFHMYRAKHIAGTLGFSAVGVPAETPYAGLRVLYHCREAVALLKDLIVVRK